MNDQSSLTKEGLSLSWLQRVDEVCDRFEDAWKAGQRPAIEDYSGSTAEPKRSQLLRELLVVELEYRRESGESLVVEDYVGRFPEHVDLIRAVFAEVLAGEGSKGAASSECLGSTRPDAEGARGVDQPVVLGRYQITGTLGTGAFGVVYRGYDDELRRDVAIKVPHRHRVAQPEDVEAYLAEARIVASLDHPNIVPVYDAGRTDDGLCFVISKFIEGSDLKARIKEARPSVTESAELLATVALALQYAHQKRLVHRDLKPANILLDSRNKPYLTDFGLALKEEDFGRGEVIVGTPAYMSPEQANGEGHLVDGRSDIFSLGVVFYELLAGRRPFLARENRELLRLISTAEIRPPRQLDVTIPRELDRICLKALAKRANERYTTAFDLADDLHHWLAQTAKVPAAEPSAPREPPLKIVPKGLRSFDAQDADFFLELLPGPRDREGLPESIRFWKSRIEEIDPDNTFRVGLIYGPSGCGKSSLVKAGLLPRLGDHVIAVYIEASAGETETRLSNSLRKRCSSLPANVGLKETLAALRRGQGIPASKKVLIVLDQFEQWLHANREEQNTELMEALRQCDGSRLQCVVMVRDDFWMAITRLMQALEVELVPGRNIAVVDLFDLRHARKVLAAFGCAFGALPGGNDKRSKHQEAFLDQAVAELARDGKVICVRLAVFAEMVKAKSWAPATLKEVGGTEGVGVTFLEETFCSSSANPRHRLHEQAARSVLKALLPETGTVIKGQMRSQQELLQASGYASRPKDFEELLRVLDGELRLVTPTDPEGVKVEDLQGRPPPGEKDYQLTHDYLVPSLRAWLTRKQKETRRGRAELRLAERAAAWNAKPENRHLPASWEWANMRLLTQRKDWTTSQAKMMRKAARFHAVRGTVLAIALVLLALIGLESFGRLKAHHLRDRLLNAAITDVPAVLKDMESYRRWVNPLLQDAYVEAKKEDDARKQLALSLALLPVDSNQFNYLYGRLLTADPEELLVIRDTLLKGQRAILVERLQNVVGSAEEDHQRRLRAACALAGCDGTQEAEANGCWQAASSLIANQLLDAVQNNPSHYPLLLDLLRPARASLLAPLAKVYRAKERAERERSFAANILADYAADQPQVLADLLMDGDDKQFAVLYPKVQARRDRGLAVLQAEVDTKLPPGAKNDAKEKLAKRQANAAVALLRLNIPDKVWPLLKHSPDPRVRSYLVDRFRPLGADARALVKRLDEEPDVSIRRALILSLGDYGEEAWPPGERSVLITKMQKLYRTAEDPGLHAAAEWLLRQPPWQQAEWLRQTNEAWAKDRAMQEKRLQDIRQVLTKEKGKAAPQWYVNSQGQTMVVVPGPVEFVMGSPPTEEERSEDESQHRIRIGRTFAIAATPVTVGEYRLFIKGYTFKKKYAPTAECPVQGTSWYDAAAYCNWLSKEEAIPEDQWCYETNPQGEVVKLKEKYLSLVGCRLPTEAEWEYACRAGAVTSRYYGESEELLGKYGWHILNCQHRSWPVGSKKPNDWGLFDMHGNVWTWCQERYQSDPKVKGPSDTEDLLSINNEDYRVLRGGSFGNLPLNVRSAYKRHYVPTIHEGSYGLRAARTLTPE